MFEYDCHHWWLIENAARGSTLGWAAKLHRYLDDLPANASKGMDVIFWWSKQASAYPTLAWITQDICAIPASLVPCECLFSAGAEIATDCQSRLGAEKFEELQILKYAWWNNIIDRAAVNSKEVSEVFLQEYKDWYKADEKLASLNSPDVEVIM